MDGGIMTDKKELSRLCVLSSQSQLNHQSIGVGWLVPKNNDVVAAASFYGGHIDIYRIQTHIRIYV